MKILRKILLIVLLINVLSIHSQSPVLNNKFLCPDETLIYKVKWTFIRVGTITIKTKFCEDNPDNIIVSMLVESNPIIPFVDINEYNETIIDRKTLMSNSFYGLYRNGSDKKKYLIQYDSESKSSIWKAFDASDQEMIDSVKIDNCPRYVDGPSLFFFTRANANLNKTINVPTMIGGKIEETKIVFTNIKEEIEIDALDHPIMAKQYLGFADWEGGSSQSLSGDFMGWISDDVEAIPVYAEVEVLIGHLKIELESWQRGNWNRQLNTAKNSSAIK
jgi:hypothetical protein